MAGSKGWEPSPALGSPSLPRDQEVGIRRTDPSSDALKAGGLESSWRAGGQAGPLRACGRASAIVRATHLLRAPMGCSVASGQWVWKRGPKPSYESAFAIGALLFSRMREGDPAPLGESALRVDGGNEDVLMMVVSSVSTERPGTLLAHVSS